MKLSRLLEIEASYDATTEGHWEAVEYVDYFDSYYKGWQVEPIWELIGVQDNNRDVVSKNDAEFIANAHNEYIPELLAEIRQLHWDIERLQTGY